MLSNGKTDAVPQTYLSRVILRLAASLEVTKNHGCEPEKDGNNSEPGHAELSDPLRYSTAESMEGRNVLSEGRVAQLCGRGPWEVRSIYTWRQQCPSNTSC